ncbi:MAG: DUF1573 domain-containing protein [Armatimonadota bacterium]|nr:DUF1573 domain-containing protein [Armatimonadota bacterium]
MKRILGPLSLAMLPLLLAAPVFPSPHIQFEATTVDVGEVRSEQLIQASFDYRNTGDVDLKIQGIDKSCSCIVTKASLAETKPGGLGKIEVEFVPNVPGGTVSNFVTVHTNDPERPSVELRIDASIKPVAVLTPARIDFGNLPVGATKEESINIVPVEPKDFRLGDIKSSGKCVAVSEVKATHDDKGTYVLKLRISAGDAPGQILEIVQIGTSVKGANLGLLVFGNVVSSGSNGSNQR